jgi:hypothetical protein
VLGKYIFLEIVDSGTYSMGRLFFMSDAIVVEHLSKMYSSNAGAQDITFSVRQGEILGLIGWQP